MFNIYLEHSQILIFIEVRSQVVYYKSLLLQTTATPSSFLMSVIQSACVTKSIKGFVT
jgi:hypothetical protein